MKFFIPPTHVVYKIKSDSLITVDWDSKNLNLLKAHKLTDKVVVSSYDRIITDGKGNWVSDDSGKYITERVERKGLIVNPLFKEEDGSTIPVDITVVAETEIEFLKYNMKTINNRKQLFSVQGRFISSPEARLRRKSFVLPISEVNKIEIYE